MGLTADARRRALYDGVDVAAAVEAAKPSFELQPWDLQWRCRKCGHVTEGDRVPYPPPGVGYRLEQPERCANCGA